jgi:hypothetical protein
MGGMGKPDDVIEGKAEPRFDRDFSYGKQGELLIGEYLEQLARGHGQVEVKRKRILDLGFFVETKCDKGRSGTFQPSGISTTTATTWAFVIGDTGIALFVPTDLLRAMFDSPLTQNVACVEGNCPTKGKLIYLIDLVNRLERNRIKRGHWSKHGVDDDEEWE